jgi:hypothetical protein
LRNFLCLIAFSFEDAKVFEITFKRAIVNQYRISIRLVRLIPVKRPRVPPENQYEMVLNETS